MLSQHKYYSIWWTRTQLNGQPSVQHQPINGQTVCNRFPCSTIKRSASSSHCYRGHTVWRRYTPTFGSIDTDVCTETGHLSSRSSGNTHTHRQNKLVTFHSNGTYPKSITKRQTLVGLTIGQRNVCEETAGQCWDKCSHPRLRNNEGMSQLWLTINVQKIIMLCNGNSRSIGKCLIERWQFKWFEDTETGVCFFQVVGHWMHDSRSYQSGREWWTQMSNVTGIYARSRLTRVDGMDPGKKTVVGCCQVDVSKYHCSICTCTN